MAALSSLLLVTFASVVPISGDRLTIDLDASAVANLTYQLDCMAERIQCSTPSFRKLWVDQLGWTAEDQQALEQWSELSQKYDGYFNQRGAPDTLGVPFARNKISFSTRRRHAGFLATDLDSYRAYLGLLVRPADADAATQVLRRFWPRFERWWKATARQRLETSMHKLSALFAKHQLLAFFERVAAFYEVDLPKGTHLPMHLILRPTSVDTDVSGQQLEQHAVVEVCEEGASAFDIAAIAHELFHYFFASMPQDRAEALLRQFIDADAPTALAAYGLLSEGLSTALGNGLVAKRVLPAETFEYNLRRPGSLYGDPAIDADARALLEPLQKLLDDGKTVTSPAFVAAQIDAVHPAGPVDYLKTMLRLYDPEFESVYGHVQRALRPTHTESSTPLDGSETLEMLEGYSQTSGIVLVSTQRLSSLNSWPGLGGFRVRLAIAARAHQSLIFGVKRGPKAWLWILAAPDVPAMDALIDSFASSTELHEGLYPQ